MRTSEILLCDRFCSHFCLCHRRQMPAISGLTRVASGLSSPIFMTYAPGDRSRLFIVERGRARARMLLPRSRSST